MDCAFCEIGCRQDEWLQVLLSVYFSSSPDKQVLFSHFIVRETESERLDGLSKGPE